MADMSAYFKTFSTHPTCRIVIDSCSDATLPMVRAMGVDLIEFPFVMADGDHLDDQYQSMTPAEFYGRMRSGERVLTSAIPTGRFVEVFEWCAEQGVPTLYLSFTAGLSSSVLDAQQAASMVLAAHPEFDLLVMDNCLPALTASLLAIGACYQRDEGMTMRQVAAWCSENKSRVHGYFTLDSLDWLVAGGRVPKAAASLSSVLDMKANLTYDLDGALTLTGVSRGRKKAIKNLVKELAEGFEEGVSRVVGIVDADCPADAATLERLVREELGERCPQIYHMPLNPTIGAHVGPGMLALAFWGSDRAANAKRGKR